MKLVAKTPKVQSLKASVLAIMIFTTIVILFFLKKNEIYHRFSPLSSLKWTEPAEPGSHFRPSTTIVPVTGSSKSKPKDSSTGTLKVNSQLHASNRSTTNLHAEKNHSPPFVLKTNQESITAKSPVKDSSLLTTTLQPNEILVNDRTTKSTTRPETASTHPPFDYSMLFSESPTKLIIALIPSRNNNLPIDTELLDVSTSNYVQIPSSTITRHPPNESDRYSTTTVTSVKEADTTNPPSKVGSTVSTINPLQSEGATYSTFNSGPSFDPFFTDFLPRSAYFDSRPRDGHDNATVILVQALKTVFEEKRVIKCGVNDHFTSDFFFKPLGLFTPWVHKHYPRLTHDQAMLTCYDLPAQQGSRVFVLYKHKNGTILKIETERRLYIPSEHKMMPESKWKSSFLVCTTVYGTPPWSREWLVYQKTIGVDFIHIYAQESFITNGGLNNSVLQSYVQSGYAKLDVWKAYLNKSQDFYYQQPLLYVDCIYRYRTEFDYALLYDYDDFFVPRIPGKTDIHYYADRFFGLSETIAATSLRWIMYYPSCGLTAKPVDIVDGNVTNHLAFHGNFPKYLKTMYKLSGVTEVQIHVPKSFYPGYGRFNPFEHLRKKEYRNVHFLPLEFAYVAHVRRGALPKVGTEERNECFQVSKISVHY